MPDFMDEDGFGTTESREDPVTGVNRKPPLSALHGSPSLGLYPELLRDAIQALNHFPIESLFDRYQRRAPDSADAIRYLHPTLGRDVVFAGGRDVLSYTCSTHLV